MKPLISIIIPTYNRAYILPRAIGSVLNQTYSNWELIIVDDGSTDTTKELIESYDDARIIYVYQENKGPSPARNMGLRNTRGEWIAYLDSDDELVPEYLQTTQEWINDNPNTLYLSTKYKRMMEIFQNGEMVDSYEDSVNVPEQLTVRDIFLRTYYFSMGGFMHSRKIFEEGIVWDEQLVQSEDWDFFMQIGEKYPDNFIYIPIVLWTYHRSVGTDGVSSNTTHLQMANSFEYIYQKHKNDQQLIGQTWYPERVEKYKKFYQEAPDGKIEDRHWKDGVVQKKKRVGEQ